MFELLMKSENIKNITHKNLIKNELFILPKQ